MRELAADGVLNGTGCGEGLLCPHEPLLRWEMAVWLVRVLDGEDPELDRRASAGFDDVDDTQWWAAHVRRLAQLGITRGCATEPLRYCPEEAVTRAQMASFLARAFDLRAAAPAGFADTADNVHEANIHALFEAGVTVGCATEPLRFCPERDTTRAQMASFLTRALQLES